MINIINKWCIKLEHEIKSEFAVNFSSNLNTNPRETVALSLFLNIDNFLISFKYPSKYEFSYGKVLISGSERLVRLSHQLQQPSLLLYLTAYLPCSHVSVTKGGCQCTLLGTRFVITVY